MNLRKGWKRRAAAMLLCLLCIASTGCMGARSPDEYGYAVVIGIDKGETKPFYVTMLLQRGNGDTQSSENNLCPLVGVECEDLFEAVDLMESSLPFSLNLARTTAIVFGEELARSGELEQFLSASLSTLQIRYYANLITARGSAKEYLGGLQSELNPNIAKLQYTFIEYSESTGLIPAITLAQFYDRAWNAAGDVVLPLGAFDKQECEDEAEGKKGAEQPAEGQAEKTEQPTEGQKEEKEKNTDQSAEPTPTPTADILGSPEYMPGQINRQGGLEAGMMGSALYKGTRLVGFLNGPHTQILMMATGIFKEGRIQIPDPNGHMVSILLAKKGAPKTTLALGEHPWANIRLELYASVDQPAIVANIGREQLQNHISSYLESSMQEVFAACQQLGCDVFQLGDAAVVQFTDTRQWETFDWDAAYQAVEASFTVDIFIQYNPTGSRLE